MENKILLMITSAILSTAAFCESALAQENIVQQGTDCGGKCSWTYDSASKTLSFTGTGHISGQYKSDDFGPVENLVIGEGITRIGNSGATFYGNFGNVANSKLVLPSTLTAITQNSIYSSFKTIEMSTQNMSEMSWAGIRNGGLNNLVLTPGGNFSIPSNTAITGSFNVQCKGAIANCQSVLSGISSKVLNLEHYKEYDSNQKLTLAYDDTGYAKYDANGNVSERHDLKGKLLAQYTYYTDGSVAVYDAAGNLTGMTKRGTFTPTEANMATKKDNNNTVSITW